MRQTSSTPSPAPNVNPHLFSINLHAFANMASAPNNAGSANGGGPANGPPTANALIFERILERFKAPLKKKDRDNFQMTTLPELQQAIGEIQKKQQSERRMQNMTRIGKFVEAVGEYGKVVEVFCNSSQFVPFIWVSCIILFNVSVGNRDLRPVLFSFLQRHFGITTTIHEERLHCARDQ